MKDPPLIQGGPDPERAPTRPNRENQRKVPALSNFSRTAPVKGLPSGEPGSLATQSPASSVGADRTDKEDRRPAWRFDP